MVASETPDQQEARAARTGQASHQTYADTLRRLHGDCRVAHRSCLDGGAEVADLASQDGVLFAGSPIQMYEDTAETRAAARFMSAVYAAGVPSFGSCAGLQIAAVAAGGTTKPRAGAMEAGFARGITATEAGRCHPLLRGRPPCWDAPAMHSTIVDRAPPGLVALARAEGTPVEAAEIRSGAGTFWGVQYHPELAPGEIAAALRRQRGALVEDGLAADGAAVDRYADALDALDADPGRRDLAWQLGLGLEVLRFERRTRELGNFLRHLAERAVVRAAE